ASRRNRASARVRTVSRPGTCEGLGSARLAVPARQARSPRDSGRRRRAAPRRRRRARGQHCGARKDDSAALCRLHAQPQAQGGRMSVVAQAAPRPVINTNTAGELTTDSLRTRTVRGALASTIAQAANIVLRTGSMIVLSRLVVPRDFGLVAMVTAV